MPDTYNDETRVHYEVEGQGPPLLCIHGLWSSHRVYHDGGWVAALAADYRLLLPDLRGHGQSAKPHASDAYTPNTMAADLLAVLDAEGIPTAHVLGYSLGGWVAHAVARVAPERVRTLIVGGAGVDPHQTRNAAALRFTLRALGQGIGALLRSMTMPNLSENMQAQLLRNDPEALRALITAWLEHPTNGFEQLGAFARPALVFGGDRDPYAAAGAECAAALPLGRYVALPGHTHDSALLDGADAITAVRRFLRDLDHTTLD